VKSYVISSVGHVALRVRDLDAALWTADRIMGLRVSGSADGWVYLTHGACHHSLQLRAGDVDTVDHIGLEAAGHDGLAEVRSRVHAGGLPVITDGPLDEGIEDGFAFAGPDGVVFEVYVGMAQGEPVDGLTGVRPARFGHVNIHAPDPGPLIRTLQEVLDFRVSDLVRGGAFLRCNVDHHGIAVLPGPEARIHHHAWEVQTVADLGRLGDLLDEYGQHLIWGPLRHGVGRNIAAYFVDPSGMVVEYYADMQRIYDEATYVPEEWDMAGHRWWSMWAPLRPDDFTAHGLPFANARDGHRGTESARLVKEPLGS
jgi:catechol-2,3-dioxygenase